MNDTNSTQPHLASDENNSPGIPNPHILWKQLTGLVIASIIFFYFGGLLIVLPGIFAFIDAWNAGIYKRKDVKSFLNISPMGWGIAMEGLLILAYPLYVIKRNTLKTKKGNVLFFVLTIIFGALTFLFIALQILRLTPTIQPETGIRPPIRLRSEPLTVSNIDGAKPKEVFRLDRNRRPLEYIENDFEDRGEVVIDQATGLMWQKSGSDKALEYEDAREYIQQLNCQRFAGYDDWRLPTIEELMSLLEPETQSNGLYISPIFDAKQPWCWSADRNLSGSAWGIYFNFGNVYWRDLDTKTYVRCVRSDLTRDEKLRSTAQKRETLRKERMIPTSTPPTFPAYAGNFDRDVWSAVLQGDAAQVKALLDKGADANAKAPYGSWTILMHAVEAGHTDTVKILLDNGADLDAKGEDGETALMLAAYNGHTDIFQLLKNRGATGTNIHLDLMHAAATGHITDVNTLLANGADKDWKIMSGETVLMAAARQGHTGIVNLLLEKSADVNALVQLGINNY